MEVILNSDIARLVLGYLREQNLERAAVAFCKKSPFLAEEYNALKRGYRSVSLGCGNLIDIVREYCQVKSKVLNYIDALPGNAKKVICEQTSLDEKIDIIFEIFKCGSVENYQQSKNQNNKRKRKHFITSDDGSENSTPENCNNYYPRISKRRRISSSYILVSNKRKSKSKYFKCNRDSSLSSQTDISGTDCEIIKTNHATVNEKLTKKITTDKNSVDVHNIPGFEDFSERLLDNKSFHDTLAEHINQEMQIPPNPESAKKCSNIEKTKEEELLQIQLDDMIKNVITNMERNPLFDEVIEDVLYPKNTTPSNTTPINKNSNLKDHESPEAEFSDSNQQSIKDRLRSKQKPVSYSLTKTKSNSKNSVGENLPVVSVAITNELGIDEEKSVKDTPQAVSDKEQQESESNKINGCNQIVVGNIMQSAQNMMEVYDTNANVNFLQASAGINQSSPLIILAQMENCISAASNANVDIRECTFVSSDMQVLQSFTNQMFIDDNGRIHTLPVLTETINRTENLSEFMQNQANTPKIDEPVMNYDQSNITTKLPIESNGKGQSSTVVNITNHEETSIPKMQVDFRTQINKGTPSHVRVLNFDNIESGSGKKLDNPKESNNKSTENPKLTPKFIESIGDDASSSNSMPFAKDKAEETVVDTTICETPKHNKETKLRRNNSKKGTRQKNISKKTNSADDKSTTDPPNRGEKFQQQRKTKKHNDSIPTKPVTDNKTIETPITLDDWKKMRSIPSSKWDEHIRNLSAAASEKIKAKPKLVKKNKKKNLELDKSNKILNQSMESNVETCISEVVEEQKDKQKNSEIINIDSHNSEDNNCKSITTTVQIVSVDNGSIEENRKKANIFADTRTNTNDISTEESYSKIICSTKKKEIIAAQVQEDICWKALFEQTPLKEDLINFPITPQFLSPLSTDTPVTKMMNKIRYQVSDQKNPYLPTPSFAITPGNCIFSKEKETPLSQHYNSRSTDYYSSGSSYYRPDESDDLDKNIETMLTTDRNKHGEQVVNNETKVAEQIGPEYPTGSPQRDECSKTIASPQLENDDKKNQEHQLDECYNETESLQCLKENESNNKCHESSHSPTKCMEIFFETITEQEIEVVTLETVPAEASSPHTHYKPIENKNKTDKLSLHASWRNNSASKSSLAKKSPKLKKLSGKVKKMQSPRLSNLKRNNLDLLKPGIKLPKRRGVGSLKVPRISKPLTQEKEKQILELQNKKNRIIDQLKKDLNRPDSKDKNTSNISRCHPPTQAVSNKNSNTSENSGNHSEDESWQKINMLTALNLSVKKNADVAGGVLRETKSETSETIQSAKQNKRNSSPIPTADDNANVDIFEGESFPKLRYETDSTDSTESSKVRSAVLALSEFGNTSEQIVEFDTVNKPVKKSKAIVLPSLSRRTERKSIPNIKYRNRDDFQKKNTEVKTKRILPTNMPSHRRKTKPVSNEQIASIQFVPIVEKLDESQIFNMINSPINQSKSISLTKDEAIVGKSPYKGDKDQASERLKSIVDGLATNSVNRMESEAKPAIIKAKAIAREGLCFDDVERQLNELHEDTINSADQSKIPPSRPESQTEESTAEQAHPCDNISGTNTTKQKRTQSKLETAPRSSKIPLDQQNKSNTVLQESKGITDISGSTEKIAESTDLTSCKKKLCGPPGDNTFTPLPVKINVKYKHSAHESKNARVSKSTSNKNNTPETTLSVIAHVNVKRKPEISPVTKVSGSNNSALNKRTSTPQPSSNETVTNKIKPEDISAVLSHLHGSDGF